MLTLALIGLIGGLITGVSPCVLPMLPIIFFAGGAGAPAQSATLRTADTTTRSTEASGAGGTAVEVLERSEPASRDLRPLKIIAGLVVSFTVFTLLGTVLLSALGLPDSFLRWFGLVVLSLVGIGLIVPAVGHLVEKPFYNLPKINNVDSAPFVFGLGLGTLYVPCAGPVLAAITVAGATGHIGLGTIVLTLTFAFGASLPLLVFASAGARIGKRIAAYRRRARLFRIGGGVVMLLLAVALAFNATDVLQRAVPGYTSKLEKRLADSDAVQGALAPQLTSQGKDLEKCTPGAAALTSCGAAPSIKGTQKWFNTPGGSKIPIKSLTGKVVLVDFWAYSCINCQRAEPHLVKLYDAYKSAGLEIIGVHSPEFAFERSTDNLQKAIKDEHITYPVAQDNNLSTWTNYRNRYWPARYLVDADGTVRALRFGEGGYSTVETQVRRLLTQADPSVRLPAPVDAGADGPVGTAGETPETYLGYSRSSSYTGSTELELNSTKTYTLDDQQADDSYSLGGRWTFGSQSITAGDAARLQVSTYARKVFHVLSGTGTVTVSTPGLPDRVVHVDGSRLYTLVDDKTPQRRVLTLTYSTGIKAFTFSFG